MRKFVLAVLAFSVIQTSTAWSQEKEKNNFLFIGIGTLTVPEILSKFVDIWATSLTSGYSSSDTRSSIPALSFGYKFYQTERYSFGGSVTFEKLTKSVTYGTRSAGKIDASIISPMLDVRYEYISSETFGATMSLGVGMAFLSVESNYDDKSETVNKTILALQFEPLGLRIGKNVVIQLGLGLGMKGLFTGSLGYRF